MYKPIVVLIILGLIFPIFSAQDAGIFNKKVRDPSNTEESSDFWNFNPNADSGTDNIPSGTKKSGSKKSTINELEQILKTMESTLSKMGATTTTERFLVDSPVTGTNEEEFVFLGDNHENNIPEEQGEESSFPVTPNEPSDNTQEETSEEEHNSEENPIETTPTENESETENGGDETPAEEESEEEETQPEEEEAQTEEEESQPEEAPTEEETEQPTPSVAFDAQNTEAGTATLSASIEYDMQFSTFNQEAGKATFLKGIASTLGLDESFIRVTNIREGSVIFDFEITLPAGDQQTKDSSMGTLEAFASRLQDGAQDGSLSLFDNASVLDFQRKITVFAPTSEVSAPSKDNSLVTVLIVISGVIILGAVGFFVYKNKKGETEIKNAAKEPKYKMSAKSEAERLDLESRGTASRTSLGEVVGDKLKLFSNSPPSDLDF